MADGLSIEAIDKTYGSTRALQNVSLEVAEGEIVAVLGPSGSGKSTLLAVVAGLEAPDAGDIRWKGASLRGMPPYKRGFGLMFQDFALFPHMNAFKNVAFGLRMANMEEKAVQTQVEEMLELVGLGGFGERDINTLSGGEQQRVALARSLAPHPRLLMLDEPLGSLDRNLRERLIVDLRKILKRMHQTALYITHDQEEAFTLADRVALMNAGRVEQAGTPQSIYRCPVSLFVARFLGLTNVLPGQVRQEGARWMVKTPIGEFPAPGGEAQRDATVLFRPDAMRVSGDGDGQLKGILLESTFRGSTTRAVVEIGGHRLTFDFLSNVELPTPGEEVRLVFDPQEAIQILPQ